MQPSAWIRVAEEVHRAFSVHAADGVVIVHGTDTMAYGASLVAFLLGPLPGPVVFTGAQKPLSDVRTDARQNLVDATLVATMGLPEVVITFGARAYRGVTATKIDAFGFEAFSSPNAAPLVTFGTGVEVAKSIRTAESLAPLDVRLDTRVAYLRVVPGLTPEIVRAILGAGVRGLVLSTYGTGTLPGALVPCLEEARAAGVVVLAVSQCLRGYVDLGRYEAGAAAEAAGVVSGGGMTVEAALAKLMVGLGRLDGPEALRAYLVQDTLGELS
jgi:L-asparaginase type I